MKIKVLIVEDDTDLSHLLKQYLEANGFEAAIAGDGFAALAEVHEKAYDILLLDVMMPNEDGFALADKLNKRHPGLPFLFLTARKMKEDVLKGLKLGAADYILKPFDADELILRIQNILKRNQPRETAKTTYRLGIYQLEPENLVLYSANSQRTLTLKEAQLLSYLCQHPNQLIRREELLNLFWDEANFFNGRSMDVFISRLRKYLCEDPSIQIESLRGLGFRLTI